MPQLHCRVLYKQRDNRFYPPSAFSLALLLVRIPFQLAEAVVYSCVVYFWVGERPESLHNQVLLPLVSSCLAGCLQATLEQR